MNNQPNSLREIFTEALEIDDPQQRADFLVRACDGDAALRHEVEELLAAEAASGKFLPKQPPITSAQHALLGAVESFASSVERNILATEKAGDRIGRYKLLEKIGEGGCGMVYMAEQEEPVRRKVALKVIKLGMDTKSVIARFEAERQASAMMDHPNIAKVLDAGATETGRPYFVMELVRGIKITDYCDQHQLSTHARLELFIQVCHAVQHAHQKGIIHRDLKPSNILVTVNDGFAIPKVIDFGIAKATEGKLTDQTLFTAFEQFLGTPAYMSPEQAAMTSLDIDTRSDIYSLGVLLYELLTGSTPFDTKELLALGVDELRRTIREKEPKRPSTRLTAELVAAKKVGRATPCAPSSSEASSIRGAHGVTRPTEESALRTPHSAIDPDLDWIVMKCLEKDRARRYETANGLAADLRRHLDNEPVIARPPSRLYELQKTVRRHKVGFAASGAVIVALVVGSVASAWQAVRATRARELAETRAYTSDMNLAMQVWEEGNSARALAMLRAHIPKPGELDRRGFEWRYLWKLCRDESRHSFTNFSDQVRMVLSPDGSFVAVGSGRVVKLLDYVNGRELDTLQLPAGNSTITAIAFLPTDTNLLATVSQKTVHFWNLAEKRITHTLMLSRRSVALAISPDGRLLASADGGGAKVELWRVEDRSPVWMRQAVTTVYSLAFSRDSKSLVSTGGKLGEPLVWDLATGNSSPFPVQHRGSIQAFTFSPDGQTMATSSADGTVILWDFAERKLRARLIARSGGRVGPAKFSVDGRWLVVGSADSTIRLWDVATRQERFLYRGHQAEVTGAMISPDGRWIISSSWDRTVKVWDLEPRAHEEILTTRKAWVGTSAFSPDSKRLASTEVMRGVMTVWDIATQNNLAELGNLADVGGPSAFSPNGKLLVQVSGKRIQLWDAATLAPRGMWTNDFDPIALSFSPDSRTLAMSGLQQFDLEGITNRLAFWDLATQRKLNKLPAAAPLAVIVAFSHDGKKVAVGYLNGEVRVWDHESERLLAEFTDQRSRIWAVTFSPNDAWLVAGGNDGVVVFHDLRSRQTLRPIKTSHWILALRFAPDGKTLASGEGDGTIKLWNVATREIALTLRGHIGPISQNISFSPDGKYLATCGADGTGRLWPAASLEEIDGKRSQP